MADPNRTLVDKLVNHHAVTGLWSHMSKPELARWFSDNGFARAYGSNPANWSGLVNPYTGERSYSQAHLAGQRVDDTTPDASAAERAAGYRLVPLVADIWGQICWHAGNWAVNQSSIGIEHLGDYRNYPMREGDARVIADFWRPRDRELGGATTVLLHNEVYATACPARIAEIRDRIVELINNGTPAPEPTPAPTPPAPSPTLYKLNVDGKQVAAYSSARNAYNGFVQYGGTGQIMLGGVDVTAAVRAEFEPKPEPEPTPTPPADDELRKRVDNIEAFLGDTFKGWS